MLKQFCDNYGMKINKSKTKLFTNCGNLRDSKLLRLSEYIIYLGFPFTWDGSASSAVKVHANTKMVHVNKFVSFLKKNNDIPFRVKKRIFDAVLISAILYGCESWLNADLRPVTKLYNLCLKQLVWCESNN